mgnify:CR=1 FL=1
MRKKWGIILGLTGMMLLGAQSIYAAEAADGTAETTDAFDKEYDEKIAKKQQAQMILRARLRKVALLPELPCMIHLSSKTMTLTISLAPIWNLRSPQI